MTPSQVQAVKQSFALVAPIADQAGTLFYQRLFESDPSLRPLFKGDIGEQSRKLMQTIATVVNSLDRLEALLPAVKALGARHAGYGVRDEHYATVGAALLWTLEQGLGEHFTPPVHDGWAAAYGTLATVMQAAAAEPTAGAAGG